MSLNLSHLGNLLKKKVEKAAVKNSKIKFVAETVLESLLKETPIDTTLAMSNWVVTVGEPSKEAIPAHVKGSQKSTENVSYSIAYSEGLAAIATRKEGEDIYITNRAKHISELEDGKSPQNKGFVKRAIERGKAVAGVDK